MQHPGRKPTSPRLNSRPKPRTSPRPNPWPAALAAVVLSLGLAAPAWAGATWDRIQKTGKIVAGARKDAIPFGFVNEKGEWVGYGLDVLERIRRETERTLGKPIRLELVAVTAQNRFDKLRDRTIDIECGATSFTWERDRTVDFSLSYFLDGTKILTRVDSGLTSIDSLARRRIGVIPKTTNEAVIRALQPQSTIVPVADRAAGLQKLEAGEIDGLASDGILLDGLRRTSSQVANLHIIPQSRPYSIDSYACALPENDSSWRNTVDLAIARFLASVIADRPEATEIFDRWFGNNAAVTSETLRDYFQKILDTTAWPGSTLDH